MVVLCAVSGIVGGALSRQFGTATHTISYADFIAVMLTAVSLLIALLAIVLAVFGVIGWKSIQDQTHAKTREFLAEGFEKGNPLYAMLRTRVDEAMFQGIESLEESVGDSVERAEKE